MENITIIVSGMDEDSLEDIAKIYELVIEAGVHRACSIKVAEAAKVVENSQRDINIAFMNELADEGEYCENPNNNRCAPTIYQSSTFF